MLAASPASASQPARANGWEVHQAEQFCYMWLDRAGAEGTAMGLAIDTDDEVFLVLTNKDWLLQSGRSYRLAIDMDGTSLLGRARTVAIDPEAGRLALTFAVTRPSFLNEFVSSSSVNLRLRPPNAPQAALAPAAALDASALSGSSAALAKVRQCTQRLKRKAGATARWMMPSPDLVRRDAPFVKPGGKN